MSDVNSKIEDVKEKLKKEKMVLDGATKMLAVQTQAGSKQLVEISIAEARRRIEFLEGELRKLSVRSDTEDSATASIKTNATQKRVSIAQSSNISSTSEASPSSETARGPALSILGGPMTDSRSSLHGSNVGTVGIPEGSPSTGTVPETIFDFLSYGTAITAENVKFRLRQIQNKLDIEQKVRTGTENMLSALGAAIENDPRRKAELDQQLIEAKSKEALLMKARNKFSQLYVASDEADPHAILESSVRKTGRLLIKLCSATNVTGRKSLKEDIVANIVVDGILKHSTRPTKLKWDEFFDITVDKAVEVEIDVFEKGGPLLAICWFKIQHLEESLIKKYGTSRASNLDGITESSLEMEPSGQLSMKLNFVPIQRTKTEKDRIFRRNPVQKVYPRNGHRFLAQQFYQVMQCALCGEFLGRQGYQCQACRYTIHARCYHRVITKCIPPDEIPNAPDKNTGQLLKYKIPHRWENVTNLGASWCSHCGYLVPPGRKIHRCSECSKSSHKECSAMIPFFCGLAPDTAATLVAAFEEHEKKMIQKEMDEAEKARKAAPVYDVVDAKVISNPDIDLNLDKQEERASHAVPTPAVVPQAAAPAAAQLQPTPVAELQKRPTTKPAATTTLISAKTVTIDDFHLVAVIGRGAFGKVMLATEKGTNTSYAIKALKKEYIIQNDDVRSTNLEKSIFQAASTEHHPFMLNLHSSFQTDSRVYFVMEYVPGGDLMCHIQEKKRFSQARTRFYACEVLLALQYFHKNNIVYRDLKLDNILLGADGHIKVADYGICKANMPFGATTSTFCGTPDYMAPEILMNRRYGIAVDWWSFGVLIYVMLVGRYPFHGEEENDILDAILSDAIEYPSNMPRVTISLLQSLMNKMPTRRLGAGSADAEEVKKHPYFANVDWDAFMRKEVPPPFVPTIKDSHDVSNFDKEFTREEPTLTPITTMLGDADQKEFRDFNFVSEWAYQERLKICGK